jgi:hypothetical protein
MKPELTVPQIDILLEAAGYYEQELADEIEKPVMASDEREARIRQRILVRAVEALERAKETP